MRMNLACAFFAQLGKQIAQIALPKACDFSHVDFSLCKQGGA